MVIPGAQRRRHLQALSRCSQNFCTYLDFLASTPPRAAGREWVHRAEGPYARGPQLHLQSAGPTSILLQRAPHSLEQLLHQTAVANPTNTLPLARFSFSFQPDGCRCRPSHLCMNLSSTCWLAVSSLQREHQAPTICAPCSRLALPVCTTSRPRLVSHDTHTMTFLCHLCSGGRI